MEVITATTGLGDGETTPLQENEEHNSQAISNEAGEVEKGSGYGPPGAGSGVTVPADDDEKSSEKADLDSDSFFEKKE